MSTARLLVCSLVVVSLVAPSYAADNTPPAGFVALFNGKDLAGWVGLPVRQNPKDPTKLVALTMPERLSLPAEELAKAQALANESAKQHWRVENGVIIFDGKGQNLCTDKDYGDFELYVDWKIEKDGDSGIYL